MGNISSSAESAAQTVLDRPAECPVSHHQNLKAANHYSAPPGDKSHGGSGGGSGCPVNHVSFQSPVKI